MNYSRSFAQDFTRVCEKFSSHIAVCDSFSNEKYTYQELQQLSDAFWNLLQKSGVKKGSTVGSIVADGMSGVLCLMTIMKNNANYLPLSLQNTMTEIERYTRLAKPDFLIVDKGKKTEELSAAVNTGCKVIEVEMDHLIANLRVEKSVSASKIEELNNFLFVATSGSTGTPKCIKIDFNTLWSAGTAFADFHEFLDEKSVFFNFYPMSYLAGIFNLSLIPFSKGASVVLGQGFSGLSLMSFWSTVKRYSINVLWFSPTVLHSLSKISRDKVHLCPPELAKEIRAAFLGMGPISLAQKNNYEKALGFPLLENYSLSETTFLSSETLANRFKRDENYVGNLLPWVEARTSTETGELEVKTPFLAKGELLASEQGARENTFVPNQFWRTGDLVSLNENRFYYKGRIKNIIKRGGYLVSLDEIQACINEISGVKDVCVVQTEHSFHGECAVVCLTTDQSQLESEIRMRIVEKLARYKWPTFLALLPELPRTISGKTDRKKLESVVLELNATNALKTF